MSIQQKVAINMRADESLRNLIDQAAAVLKTDRTHFILDTMRKEAENVIMDQRLHFVDERSFEQLSELLDQPVSSNQALKGLLESTSPWEK